MIKMKLGILAITACLCMSAMAVAADDTGQNDALTYRDSLEESRESSIARLNHFENLLEEATSSGSDTQPYLEAIQIEKSRVALLDSYLSSFNSRSVEEISDVAVEQESATVSPFTPQDNKPPL